MGKYVCNDCISNNTDYKLSTIVHPATCKICNKTSICTFVTNLSRFEDVHSIDEKEINIMYTNSNKEDSDAIDHERVHKVKHYYRLKNEIKKLPNILSSSILSKLSMLENSTYGKFSSISFETSQIDLINSDLDLFLHSSKYGCIHDPYLVYVSYPIYCKFEDIKFNPQIKHSVD